MAIWPGIAAWIEDEFRGGVLCTLSALVMGFDSFVIGVRAGREACTLPLGSLLRYNLIYEEVNKGTT
jgi:hypothetical protein